MSARRTAQQFTPPSISHSNTSCYNDSDIEEHDGHRRKSAASMLHEHDDRIATELPELLPPVHYHDDHDLRRRTRSSREDAASLSTVHDEPYTLRPELMRAETREEVVEEEAHRRLGFRYNRYKIVRKPRKWWHPVVEPVRRWWARHVSVQVDVAWRRDHLALERTFLGYLRTSVALSMTGVVIAQLFRLQRSANPSPDFGYYSTGDGLAAGFISASIAVVILGAVRFWRQQSAMVRGKIWAGGWEILTIMVLSILITMALFAVLLGVPIKHDLDGR